MSLMTLIHFVSEAARFNDIEGTFRSSMMDYQTRFIPASQQHLENNWATLSSFFFRYRQNPNTPPITIVDNGTFHSAYEVRNRVRVLYGNAGTGGSYDPGHQEL